MNSLSYYQKDVIQSMKIEKYLFKNNDSLHIGIWEKAIKAQMTLVRVDKSKGKREGFYFEFNANEEGASMTESDSFAELAFKAGFDNNETEYCLFRDMVNTAINLGILIDVTDEPDVITQEGFRAYSFKEVLDSVHTYMTKDSSKVYAGVKRQATTDERDVMEKVRNVLMERYPNRINDINTFCSYVVKNELENFKTKNSTAIISSFISWGAE